jgi:hypothetical protein
MAPHQRVKRKMRVLSMGHLAKFVFPNSVLANFPHQNHQSSFRSSYPINFINSFHLHLLHHQLISHHNYCVQVLVGNGVVDSANPFAGRDHNATGADEMVRVRDENKQRMAEKGATSILENNMGIGGDEFGDDNPAMMSCCFGR